MNIITVNYSSSENYRKDIGKSLYLESLKFNSTAKTILEIGPGRGEIAFEFFNNDPSHQQQIIFVEPNLEYAKLLSVRFPKSLILAQSIEKAVLESKGLPNNLDCSRKLLIVPMMIFVVCSISNASGRSCSELFSMIAPKSKTESVVKIRDGKSFRVRIGTSSDVPAVTNLIHEAFEIWKKQGLELSPMFQTDAQTDNHLVDKGFVAENSRGEIVATFSLDNGVVVRTANGIEFSEGGDPAIPFNPLGGATSLPTGRLLVFKKTAVRSDLASSGLGSELYHLAEKMGRERGYAGMILETVKEAEWLYDWYVRLGYQPLGSYRYPGGQVDTILLIKPFAGDAK